MKLLSKCGPYVGVVMPSSTSPRRRDEVDYGEDGNKRIRHIARTKQLTTFPGQDGTQRAWSWVLKSLAYRRSNRGLGCPVQILNTVIYGIDGAPEVLYYTKDGTIVSSTIGDERGCITLANAVAHLRLPKRYAGITQTKSDTAVEMYRAVSFTTAGETFAHNMADVEKICRGQALVPTGTEALVLAVPTKAPCSQPLLSIQHVFNLETSVAKAVHRSFRLVVLKSNPKRIPCMSSTLNQKLKRACTKVLRWIEAYSGARVVRLVLEFIEDILGELWLVRSSECCTTKSICSYSHQKRSPSPTKSKALRVDTANTIADDLCILRFGHGIGESAPCPSTDFVLGSNSANEEEMKATGSNRRPHTAMSPAEVGGSQTSIDVEEWGFGQNTTASQGLNTQRPQTAGGAPTSTDPDKERLEQGDNDGGRTCQDFAESRERDPKEVGRTAAAGRALGSSQLCGKCPGDFCNTNLIDKVQGGFELEETGNASPRLYSSSGATWEGVKDGAFLQRILHLDESILQEQCILNGGDDLTKSTTGATSRRGERRGGRRLRQGKPRLRVAVASSGPDGSSFRGEEDERKEIPFSWIVRGRQERHLINRHLRRYRKGKKEAFVGNLSGLGESSLPLGAIFPATYYQSARVCRNCFRVYSMIDEARSKSVRYLDVRAERLRKRLKVNWRRQQPAAKRARRGEQISSSGKQEVDDWGRTSYSEATSKETLALMRAQAAIDGLTRRDICELRSFSKPPAAVNMVAAALMVALTGRGEPTEEGWLSAKRYMADIDKLFAAISNLDLNTLRTSQMKGLEAYARNPAFRPGVIACVSLAASRLCAWVLGVLEAHRWRTGRGHHRLDILGGIPRSSIVERPHTVQETYGPVHNSTALLFASDMFFSSTLTRGRPNTQPGARRVSRSSYDGTHNISRQEASALRSRVTSGLGPAVFPFPGVGSQKSASNHRETHSPPQQAWALPGVGTGGIETFASPPQANVTMSSLRTVKTAIADVRHASGGDSERMLRDAAAIGSQARAGRARAKARQKRTAERLADATAGPTDPVGFQRSDVVCADGVTLIPYAVVGASLSSSAGRVSETVEGKISTYTTSYRPPSTVSAAVLSFVVVHDFFDTMEKTFLLFKPLVLKHPGCQVLCFNSPGQAGTRLPQEPEELLTNEWIADRLDELMQHVDNMGEMPLSDRPFHLLGIGNGANIASAFICSHVHRQKWKPTLRSLTCINGFAAVDTQLAAVLHSAQRAFQCFPPSRPDLPITFWSRFVFSEDYIKIVGSNLALNIFCAVANPLGTDGMLRIVKGSLKSRDLRKDLPSIPVPLILIQSTDNVLINAANVDPFLERRRARHVWSHQLRFSGNAEGTVGNKPSIPMDGSGLPSVSSATEVTNLNVGRAKRELVAELRPHQENQPAAKSCLGLAGERALFESLAAGPQGAFVAWVKGGHEVRQECKRLVTDVLDLLAVPSGQAEDFFQKGVQPKRAPVGKASIAAKIADSAQVIRSVPYVHPQGGGRCVIPEVKAGAVSAMTLCENKFAGATYHPNEIRDATADGLEVYDTLRRTPNDGKRGEKNESGGNGEFNGDGSGRRRRKMEVWTPKKAVFGDTIGVQTSRLSMDGCASLRNLREQEPFPEVPEASGTRPLSLDWKLRPGVPRRSTSRATTVSSTVRPTRVRSQDSRSHRECKGLSGTSYPYSQHKEPLSPRTNTGSETFLSSAQSLEETVVDFDNAIRYHRKRRGSLRATSVALLADHGAPGVGGKKVKPDVHSLQGNGNSATISCLEGEASTAGAPSSRNDRGGHEDLPWRDEPIEGGSMTSVGDDSERARNGKSNTAPTEDSSDQTLGINPSCREDVGQTTAAHHGVELDSTFYRHSLVGASGGRLLNSSVTKPSAAPDRADQSELRLTLDPDLLPDGHAGVCRRGTTDTPPRHMECPLDKDELRSNSLEHNAQNDACYRISLGRQSDMDANRERATVEDGERDALVSQEKAFEALNGVKKMPDPSEKNDGLTRHVTVPSSAGEASVARVAGASGTSAASPQVVLGAVETFPLHVAPATASFMESSDLISTTEQRRAGNWMAGTGNASRPLSSLVIAQAEAELAEIVNRLQSQRLRAQNLDHEVLNKDRASKIDWEHADRLVAAREEDQRALAAKHHHLVHLRHKADLERLQLGAEFEELEKDLTHAGAATVSTAAKTIAVRGMRPQYYFEAEDLPENIRKITEHRSVDKVLDEMESLAMRTKSESGGMREEEFEKLEQRQRARHVERLAILRGQTAEEKSFTRLKMVLRLQLFARLIIAWNTVARLRQERSANEQKVTAAITVQRLVRGHLSRMTMHRIRRLLLDEAVLGGRATRIQKVYRGRLGRLLYTGLLRESRARRLQRVSRGFLGRQIAKKKRALLVSLAARASSATRIQSAWRGDMARRSYLRTRCAWLASREIQRVYRGHIGRRAAKRRREWQATEPGAQRLKLGMRMIEDTKVAFTKQQEEIAVLSRAQEKAEARVSSIHHQLTASESELSVLEGEMTEIDHLERELVQLTHQRDLVSRGITNAAGIPTAAKQKKDPDPPGSEVGPSGGGGDDKNLADAYALEMHLQLKRAEREQRRQQLTAEFASTFAGVLDKKQQLDRLSAAVADIEATRLRKSREFGHMQRNLMELLLEQKRELDNVREKGIQLETATATSAAAAAATAQRARDHEAKAAAMYEQTEELMKFQFMSMSLSYFSSLNMMKQMRDINADTTTVAITGSADAAAAAAASAAAASVPSMKHIGALGGGDITRALTIRKDQVSTIRQEFKDAAKSQKHPFPTELTLWSVDDVSRWLDTLQLGEYKQAFREGKVDGSFLAELHESDFVDSIGIEHKLHLKKLLLARQKLMPLSVTEHSMATAFKREELATHHREGILDIDTAFSQARHGKKRRLEETLNMGFDIEAQDENGNTLLIIAVQQLQMPAVELLLKRGAKVNHSNSSGNTALHFAMSFDTSGKMGEYLINNGADDSIENKKGLSPYDGI